MQCFHGHYNSWWRCYFFAVAFFLSSGTPSSSRFDVTKAVENCHQNAELYEERGVGARGVTASAGSMSAEIFFALRFLRWKSIALVNGWD